MDARAYFRDSTIAAIITAPNAVSAIGVIRLSGPAAWPVASSVVRMPNGKFFAREKLQSHRLYRCLILDRQGQDLDDGMFAWMENPRSFTGEDVVELQLHGNPFLLRRAMEALLHHGAKEALPGEFSFRAFRNGKLSLDQAESIADLISSRSEDGSHRALHQLLGHARPAIDGLKQEIVNRLAEMEVDIDFSDQGLSTLDYEAWAGKLTDWCERVERMRSEFLASRPRREGIRLALVGAPNSGKSSLFNRLLGEDRSIVSQQAGTTRDVVREEIQLNGLLFRLSDTAGIRSTADEIEAEGVDRSFGEVAAADALLWVFDGTEAFAEKDLRERWAHLRSHKPERAKVVAIWNKADASPTPKSSWSEFFRAVGIPIAIVSAKTGRGWPEFLSELSGLFTVEQESQPDFWISRTRHFEVLGMAQTAVRSAIRKVAEGEKWPDLLASDLREALSRLGEITGEVSTEDLLGHIFSEFCIGK